MDLGLTLHDRLRGLARFLPAFESAAFEFAKWNNPKSTDPEVFTLGFSELSETAVAFVKEAYDLGWVEQGFDWGTWMDTPEAVSLRDSPASLAKATVSPPTPCSSASARSPSGWRSAPPRAPSSECFCEIQARCC